MTDIEPFQTLEQQVQRAERRAAAVRLRTTGASVPMIAKALHFDSVDEAALEITAYLDELIRIPASELVARQQSVIMDMMRAAYKQALEGDTASIKVVKDLMDHQAKLFGLNAPTRHAISADDTSFSLTAASLINELGISTTIDVPPTIDAEEPWA